MNLEPNYSDMKRFLTSMGIILIALSIILPLLVLKEPLDTRIKAIELSELNSVSQIVIQFRQYMALGITLLTCCASPLMVLGGCVCLIVGIPAWFWQESREKYYTEKIQSAELKAMTEKEKEIFKREESELFVYVRENLKKYLSQNEYQVLENQRFGNNIYQLVIHSKVTYYEDVIIKIKYVKKQWLRKLFSIYFNFYSDILDKYKKEVKINSHLVCLIISPQDSSDESGPTMSYFGRDILLLNPFSHNWRKRKDMKFHFLRDDELKGFEKDSFLGLFEIKKDPEEFFSLS